MIGNVWKENVKVRLYSVKTVKASVHTAYLCTYVLYMCNLTFGICIHGEIWVVKLFYKILIREWNKQRKQRMKKTAFWYVFAHTNTLTKSHTRTCTQNKLTHIQTQSFCVCFIMDSPFSSSFSEISNLFPSSLTSHFILCVLSHLYPPPFVNPFSSFTFIFSYKTSQITPVAFMQR